MYFVLVDVVICHRQLNEDYIFIEGDLRFQEVPVGETKCNTIFIRYAKYATYIQ